MDNIGAHRSSLQRGSLADLLQINELVFSGGLDRHWGMRPRLGLRLRGWFIHEVRRRGDQNQVCLGVGPNRLDLSLRGGAVVMVIISHRSQRRHLRSRWAGVSRGVRRDSDRRCLRGFQISCVCLQRKSFQVVWHLRVLGFVDVRGGRLRDVRGSVGQKKGCGNPMPQEQLLDPSRVCNNKASFTNTVLVSFWTHVAGLTITIMTCSSLIHGV